MWVQAGQFCVLFQGFSIGGELCIREVSARCHISHSPACSKLSTCPVWLKATFITSPGTAPHPQELHWITHTPHTVTKSLQMGIWFPPENFKFQQMGASKQKTLQGLCHRLGLHARLRRSRGSRQSPPTGEQKPELPWQEVGSCPLLASPGPGSELWDSRNVSVAPCSLAIYHRFRSPECQCLCSQWWSVSQIWAFGIRFNHAWQDTRPWQWRSRRKLMAPQRRGTPCHAAWEVPRPIRRRRKVVGIVAKGLSCGLYGKEWASKCR